MGETFTLRPGAKQSANIFGCFKGLLVFLFQKGGLEVDTTGITTVVLEDAESSFSSSSKLDSLPFEDKKLLLELIFAPRNIRIVRLAASPTKTAFQQLSDDPVKQRIIRVQTWTGTGHNIHYEEPIWTMSSAIVGNLGIDVPPSKLSSIIDIMEQEIDFFEVLGPLNKVRLCKLVGFWEFPAHELLNNELAYCVYAMLKHAQLAVDPSIQLSSNSLLMLVVLTRDTYKSGNPFHNFRHATDVLQACFHFLIRLGCIYEPVQFVRDPLASEMDTLKDMNNFDGHDEFYVDKNLPQTLSRSANLGATASLALLVAALGHDSGHPGVTNAFMVKYNSPTSRVYNGKLVLESFHASLFSQLILSHCWPQLIKTELDGQPISQFISLCILATDMAEHFEYVGKISGIGINLILTASLLIKCADILNVTRPLRVSSQWALVLSREFDEVDLLEKLLAHEEVKDLDPKYKQLPRYIEEVLQVRPELHKGQIFFINTFAERLFAAIADHLPALAYTCDIVAQNKKFWLARNG